MREFDVEEKLKKILSKLKKKDPHRYKIIKKKILEILESYGVEHYKNLKKPLQEFKRVHINSSFILTFKYLKEKDFVAFYDFDHHDNIYKKKVS